MTPDLIILDADHTLYTPVADRAYTDLFASLADAASTAPTEAEEAWEEHYARTRRGWSGGEDYRQTAIRQTLESLGVEPREELLQGLQERFWSRVADDLTVEEGTRPMLEQLSETHTLALATDELPVPLQRKMDAAVGGVDLFDAVVTARDAGTLKPSPRFCTIPLERAGADPAGAVMVGDSWERDLAPASGVGMMTVHLTGDETRADYRIKRITALPAVLGDA